MNLTKLFTAFFTSEKSGGLILILCTVLSLSLSNSGIRQSYIHFWHIDILTKPIEFWINDGCMTIFFLLVGLEIERELYIGELSKIKQAMLPVMAAIGGMVVPALIYLAFNYGKVSQNGFGIPMATDIAFSLGILSLLGTRVPNSLKVFLTALAIIDDLGAILIIALFYSKEVSLIYLGIAVMLFAVMLLLNKAKVYKIWMYLFLGFIMWFCIYRSGIHATITGVLLAFAIPFGKGNEKSPSYVLQHHLHKPVAFLILPLFALANTAITFPSSFAASLITSANLGIIAALIAGKPTGIFVFSIIGKTIGVSDIPEDIKKKHLLGIGMLAGIGFTMSIFITLLAFTDPAIIDSAKIAIIFVSVLAGTIGFFWLKFSLKKPIAFSSAVVTQEK